MDPSQRFRALLSFAHAAEQGSFTAAARALGISAAAVSKNVAGLEAALGLRLMSRSTRSLKLTAEGEAFLGPVRTAIGALDAALDELATQRAEPAGRVRITVGSSFGRAYLMPLLAEFMDRYPRLRLEIDFEDRHVDIVRSGYDFAIRGGVPADSALVSRRICRFSTVLVAAPAYLARHGVPREIADLERHSLVAARFLSSGLSAWRFGAGRGKGAGDILEVVPEGRLAVSDPEAVVQAALMGIGIAQIGTHHAWPHAKAGRLKALMLDRHRSEERELNLQYPHRSRLPPRTRVAIEFFVERLRANEAFRASRGDFGAYQA